MAGRPKHTKEEWLTAIRDSAGVVSAVAAKLKISRQAVWKRRKANKALDDAFREYELSISDECKDNLHKAIKRGNVKVSMWWLERKAKSEGFGKEIKVENDGPQTRIVLEVPDDGRESTGAGNGDPN